ncbi:MAG: hypothetical protein COB53_04390, partial [Elusimicrobia bacterium]
MMRPLSGRTVFVTRPAGRENPLLNRLRKLGGRAVHTPAIKFKAPASWKKIDAALKRFESFDTVIFTSVTAVDAFMKRAGKRKRPRFVYAIGPATQNAVAALGWKKASTRLDKIRGKNILFPRAEAAREDLPKALRKNGARV